MGATIAFPAMGHDITPNACLQSQWAIFSNVGG
jgi:hypothetical protein